MGQSQREHLVEGISSEQGGNVYPGKSYANLSPFATLAEWQWRKSENQRSFDVGGKMPMEGLDTCLSNCDVALRRSFGFPSGFSCMMSLSIPRAGLAEEDAVRHQDT